MIFLNSINSREIEFTKLSFPFQVAETMGIKSIYLTDHFFILKGESFNTSDWWFKVLNLVSDIKKRMFLNQEHMNYKFANIYMHDNINIEEMWGSGWNLWEKKIKK